VKTLFLRLMLVLLLLGFALIRNGSAQVIPRSLDAVQEISAAGSVDFTVQMIFDAAGWRMWKAQVGDDPARLLAMIRHQFSAYVIDDFRLEKDDLKRSAKVFMHSPAGPELRKDGSFRIPVEKEFRLVNHTGREWFFSGNNPYAANSLNTVKLVLPANISDASLADPGGVDQAIIYTVEVAVGSARNFVITGVVILILGIASTTAGLLIRPRRNKGE
jgi:hypothetical protein